MASPRPWGRFWRVRRRYDAALAGSADATGLFVTHDQEEALGIGDRVADVEWIAQQSR
jgi:ABC-type Fe3+/spermidine/putrescine transport system ATPase subunit